MLAIYYAALAVGVVPTAARRRRTKVYAPNRNPTEIYHSRQALLMQEAHNRRLARRRRRADRSSGSPRVGRLGTILARASALWERARVPFFRA